MANLTLPFKCIIIFFIFFFMISHTSSSSSSSSSHSSNNNQQIQPRNPSSHIPQISHYHQVFYLKNANPNADPPTFLSRQERIKKRRMNRNKNNKNVMMKKHRKHRKKKIVKNKNMMKSPGPFSVMLPKGFVPPSGSSPCHNDQPNSMSFHCHLSSSQP
ncbi:uncharacterized protein LOC131598091 [Vicia villosa]|uniref:uncharacterized protein LOC131598091 n=1 Tax=Vicia villosa TaxID=3911 RepID=UPI00273B0DAD|nr:uncharacterized protein LOC131598091 [Vicia villosa]